LRSLYTTNVVLSAFNRQRLPWAVAWLVTDSLIYRRALTPQELYDILQPETSLEASFLEDEEFCRGLVWGVPRYGHPEGTIWRHILEVNENIDGMDITSEERRLLRIVNWVHDTFKHIEDKGNPAIGLSTTPSTPANFWKDTWMMSGCSVLWSYTTRLTIAGGWLICMTDLGKVKSDSGNSGGG
jgi:hypothetical protein